MQVWVVYPCSWPKDSPGEWIYGRYTPALLPGNKSPPPSTPQKRNLWQPYFLDISWSQIREAPKRLLSVFTDVFSLKESSYQQVQWVPALSPIPVSPFFPESYSFHCPTTIAFVSYQMPPTLLDIMVVLNIHLASILVASDTPQFSTHIIHLVFCKLFSFFLTGNFSDSFAGSLSFYCNVKSSWTFIDFF